MSLPSYVIWMETRHESEMTKADNMAKFEALEHKLDIQDVDIPMSDFDPFVKYLIDKHGHKFPQIAHEKLLDNKIVHLHKLTPEEISEKEKKNREEHAHRAIEDALKAKKLERAQKPAQPKFDYEAVQPAQDITTLSQLEVIIKRNFPSIWFETTACLATSVTLSLKNLNGCPSLILVGNPSGEKTTTLSFFYGQKETYISDDFTPRSFVSHSANVKEEDLESIDLLPKIRNKVLVTPELAPTFEAAKDDLIATFATLVRVLDGEGLNRDSGTHGHRGYSGDYKFAWLGGTTPLRSSVWNVMGKVGNRLFFLNMRDKNRTDKDYLAMFRGVAYEEKVKECRGATKSFLDHMFATNGIRQVEWNAEQDIFLLPEIIRYAKFLSRLRASLMTWKGEDKTSYEYNFPVVEEPPRAINSLYNLAKGHALLNGRRFLKSEDLAIVRAVCFSSMPHDRSEFLKILAKHEGKLTTGQIANELNCSDETARRTMKTFEILGIVTIKSLQVEAFGEGRPMLYIEINPEYSELLQYTQGRNGEGNPKPQEIRGTGAGYDGLNLQDFISKEAQAQPQNNGVNDKPQENPPAPNIKGAQDPPLIVFLKSHGGEATRAKTEATLGPKAWELVERHDRIGDVFQPKEGIVRLVRPEEVSEP